MSDYATMYRKLFNAQTDAIEGIKDITEALIKAHRETEEMYISATEPNVRLFSPTGGAGEEDK